MSLDERLRSLQEISDRVPVGDVEVALQKVRSSPRKRSARKVRIVALAVAAAVAVVVGVASVLPDPRGTTNVTTEQGSSAWQSLLESSPPDQNGFAIHDFARLADQLGVTRPGPDATDGEVDAYREQVWNPAELQLQTHLPLSRVTAEEARSELGFDHRSIDRVLTFSGATPTTGGDILDGSFDTDRIAAAIAADAQWSSSLSTETHQGTSYYAWGDEQQNLVARSPLRPLGVGGRLLVAPDRLVWTGQTATIEAIISAGATRPDAESTNALSAVVGRLDRQGSVSAAINLPLIELEPDVQAFGLGYRRDTNGSWIVELAVAYTTANAAEQGESRLQARLQANELRAARPVSETLTPVAVSTIGTMVVGSFTYTHRDVPVGHSISARGAVGSLLPFATSSPTATTR